MLRRAAAFAVLPLLLVLTACGEPAPAETPTASAPAPIATPTETVPPESSPIDPDDYLIDGGVDMIDENGMWSARYGFYLDDSKTTQCDFTLFSGDDPGLFCTVAPGETGVVSYELPEANCDASQSNFADGYSAGINGKSLEGAAGFTGCQEYNQSEPLVDAKRKVLPPYSILLVEPFMCEVTVDAVALCGYTDGSANLEWGATVANFS
jgi:predicted small lipoprotein YifL